MPKRRKRGRPKVEPLVGSQAFGNDDEGRPTGSAAIGNPDADFPLRGALLFGNDPEGSGRGSEAIGQPDKQFPLRGALLFGNDPEGGGRGSEAMGQPSKTEPLRGALLFGNDPKGNPRGSDAFGQADETLKFRGSQSFGAPQLVREKLHKDRIGYDFGGVLLQRDDGSIAGVRKDPRDSIRERALTALQRYLDVDKDRVRHGVGESAIKWGKLKRDDDLDGELAKELRGLWRIAPGEVLGIGHVTDLLEETERLHTFELKCEWDRTPIRIAVMWDNEEVGVVESAIHNEHTYYVLRDFEGELLGYSDSVVPHKNEQVARIRAPDGSLVGSFALRRPVTGKEEEDKGERANPHSELLVKKESHSDPAAHRFLGTIRDADEKVLFLLEEQLSTSDYFRAKLLEPTGDQQVGRIEDRLKDGKIRTQIRLDLAMPCVLAWALAAVMADLARLRRKGWPVMPEEKEEHVESVQDALGPSRLRG